MIKNHDGWYFENCIFLFFRQMLDENKTGKAKNGLFAHSFENNSSRNFKTS